jgi:hypothetical protein
MNLKFWKKSEPSSAPAAPGTPKLPKPQDLPQKLGQHLVVKRQMDPDFVWSLKCALMPESGAKNRFRFRVFNPADAIQKGVNVKNFTTLDDHAEIVMFSGVYDKSANTVTIDPTLQKAS